MTLNGAIALILRYFTEFNSFGADYVTVVDDLLCPQNIVFRLHLAKADSRRSHTVSLRQVSLAVFRLRVNSHITLYAC